MGVVSAKELKQRTGEILRRVRAGESFILTYRGKAMARIEPTGIQRDRSAGLRPYEEAWKDIEGTLKRTEPGFSEWRDAIRWVRGRM